MRQSLTFERWYPFIFAGFFAALSWLLEFSLPDDGRKELLSATISVGAILAGFLGTAKAILMALPQVVMTKLRSSTYLDDLAKYLGVALKSCLAVSAFSISGFFPFATNNNLIFSSLWLALFVFAVLSFWRVSNIMLIILKLDPDSL